MGNRGGQFNMPHALTPHFGSGHFHAAAIAHNTFVPHALILAAVAFPIPRWSKDLLTEKAFALRL